MALRERGFRERFLWVSSGGFFFFILRFELRGWPSRSVKT
jgi:hypothetical protein